MWLGQVGKAKDRKARLSACWKLFNYKHDRPNPSTESQVQRVAFAKFEAWRQVMATVQLNDHWAKVFVATAKEEAEVQERGAQQAQYLAWTSWLKEGPAHGLRKQHQFTKVKSGWVESALIQDNEETQGEEGLKHEDGLSFEQLKLVVKPPDVVTCRPATMQGETDMQATAWHCEWGLT